MSENLIENDAYVAWLRGVKETIRSAQTKAAWGSGFLPQLARDLKSEFPDIKGFSRSNLSYIRYRFYGEAPVNIQQLVGKIPQAVGQIPWGHNCLILDKTSDVEEALFYAQKTVEHGWSRAVLTVQLETDLYRREGKALTNFDKALPSPQSELAQQTLKDPYVFDFLSLGKEAKERDIKKALLDHLTAFLLELGAGFAFVGSQYHIEVDGEDFYIDLLFYHLKLRRYVVIDLKTDAFKPEYAGKMNFYLSAVDDQLKAEGDHPTIGILLCKQQRGKTVVEYALRDIAKPLGVSGFTHSLPDGLQDQLPSVETLRAELRELDDSD